jgi:hypothetical protein
MLHFKYSNTSDVYIGRVKGSLLPAPKHFTGKNSKNEIEVKILKSILLIWCKWKNKASMSQHLLEANEKQDEKLEKLRAFFVSC